MACWIAMILQVTQIEKINRCGQHSLPVNMTNKLKPFNPRMATGSGLDPLVWTMGQSRVTITAVISVCLGRIRRNHSNPLVY